MAADDPNSLPESVLRCVELLVDDRERQGGFLSHDDVARVISRRNLSPADGASVWAQLSSAGITVGRENDPASSENATKKPDSESPAPERIEPSFESAYGRHSLLSHADEIRLARRVQAARQDPDVPPGPQNDERRLVIDVGNAARAQLVLANIRLVIHCAKRHAALTSLPLEDLVQEGILGLFRAVDKYDPERGFRFATYATWWIEQFIARGIADRGGIIRVPAHILDRLRGLRRKQGKLATRLGRLPTAEELGRDLGCDTAEVNLLLRMQMDISSLDHHEDVSDKQVRIQLVNRFESPPLIAEREELKSIIDQVLETLDKRSRRVLVLRFGLFGNKPRTLESIGRKLGVTRERVRQIEKRALERIAQTHRGNVLKDFADEVTTTDEQST